MYTFFVVLLSKMFNFEDALYRLGAGAWENAGYLCNSTKYEAVRDVSASFAGAYYLKIARNCRDPTASAEHLDIFALKMRKSPA